MTNVLKAIGSIMPSPSMPKAPKSGGMAAMPDPGSAAAKIAAREKVEEKRKRGRQGTIYTGQSYSNQSLGGTQ